jgi:hypothetical protein
VNRLVTALLCATLIASPALAQSGGATGSAASSGGVTPSGAITTGHCAQFASGTSVLDSGAACGTISTTVPVASGGTGNTSLATGAVNTGNGTGAFVAVSPGASGTVLTSNGSGSAPSYQSPSSGTGRLIKLGSATGVNFAVTGDTAFTFTGTSKYVFAGYIIDGCSITPGAAQGGIYTGAGGTGSNTLVSTYTKAITPGTALIIGAYGLGSVSTSYTFVYTAGYTLYFRITTANATALTCNVTLMGEDLS